MRWDPTLYTCALCRGRFRQLEVNIVYELVACVACSGEALAQPAPLKWIANRLTVMRVTAKLES